MGKAVVPFAQVQIHENDVGIERRHHLQELLQGTHHFDFIEQLIRAFLGYVGVGARVVDNQGLGHSDLPFVVNAGNPYRA
ncbi:hypothetical protein D3C81_1986490 [compost metagenome]